MKKPKKSVKNSTAKLPCLNDLLPNVQGVGSLWVSDLLVNMIVEMALLARTQNTNHDQKSIVSNLELQLGGGIMRPGMLKLAALVTQVSQWVEDGDVPAKLFEYVKGRLVYAAYKHGSVGRHLLESAAVYVKNDLLDCKTDTVFHRRAA